MCSSIKEIYNKKVEGDPITDEDVLKGLCFFKQLAKDLVLCGPVFRLAFKEANDTYNTFYSYAVARNLNIPRKCL